MERCRCVADHRPYPLELHRHHIVPLMMGGGDEPANLVYVCPTTHASAHELLRTFLRERRVLGWRECTDRWVEPVSEYAYWLAGEGFRRWQVRQGALL